MIAQQRLSEAWFPRLRRDRPSPNAACNGFTVDESGSAIACPALVIAGDQDRMTPAKAGLDVTSNLPNARVVRPTNCGHAMLSERPNEVLDA